MKYKHPIKYIGINENPHVQLRAKQYVETNCLKCDRFCGIEHDFNECNLKLFGGKACDKEFENETIYQSHANLRYESENY